MTSFLFWPRFFFTSSFWKKGFFFLLLTGGAAGSLWAQKPPCPTSSCCKPMPLEKKKKPVSSQEIPDPLEDLNRSVFAFNLFVDRLLFCPVATLYRHTTPSFLRKGLHNGIQHLFTPTTFFNSLLQGKGDKAFETAVRFFINTVFGLGGLVDIAGLAELELKHEDFGKTLGYYGIKEGDYWVLPFLGPSSPRDALGRVVDWFTSPFNLTMIHQARQGVSYTVTGAHLLDIRERNLESFEALEESSVDFYAAVRSLYHQKRSFEVKKSLEESGHSLAQTEEEGPLPSYYLEQDED